MVDTDFSGDEDKIISYPVRADGILGAGRNEITTGLSAPYPIAFSGGRAYVADSDRIVSYPVGAGGILGAGRDEIMIGLESPVALAFFGGRAYVAAADFSGDEDKIISYPRFSSIPFAVAPDAPRVVAQSESDSEIEITWNAVLGATHYKLYRSETSDGLFTQVEGEISITRYRDGGLSANTLLLLSIGGLQRQRVFGSFAHGQNCSRCAEDSDAKRHRDFNRMERDCGRNALQTLSGDGERRRIYANWRGHRRARLSRQQPFRDNRLLLSTGGLQQRRVFGSFARSFDHDLRYRLFGRVARRDNDKFEWAGSHCVFQAGGPMWWTAATSASIVKSSPMRWGRTESWARRATR